MAFLFLLEGHKGGASVQENYRKTTEVARPCDEDEREARSERNARCGLGKEEEGGQT